MSAFLVDVWLENLHQCGLFSLQMLSSFRGTCKANDTAVCNALRTLSLELRGEESEFPRRLELAAILINKANVLAQLTLATPAVDSFCAQAIAGRLPLLTHLGIKVYSTREDSSAWVGAALSSGGPRLTHLELDGVIAPLRDLCQDEHDLTEDRLQPLANILNLCPSLTSLSVTRGCLSGDDGVSGDEAVTALSSALHAKPLRCLSSGCFTG